MSDASRSRALPLVAAGIDLILVTLLVAWALEDVIYFSLFVGIPSGTVSAVATYIVLNRYLSRGPREGSR